MNTIPVILDPPADCQNAEIGHSLYVCRCFNCGRLANMVYEVKGEYVVACSKACGEAA